MRGPACEQFVAGLEGEPHVRSLDRLVVLDAVRAGLEVPPLVVVVGVALLARVGLDARGLSDRGARDIWEASIKDFNSGSDYTVEVTWLPNNDDGEVIEQVRVNPSAWSKTGRGGHST